MASSEPSAHVLARGLQVDHVILFDFPTNAVDYLHRVGRTARAGKAGRGTPGLTVATLMRPIHCTDRLRSFLFVASGCQRLR